MSNLKIGDVVMWSTTNHWSSYRGYVKSKIVSETKTEFKLEDGTRVLKSNNYIRGTEYSRVKLFDIKEWEEDIELRNKSTMTRFIQDNFSEYLGLLDRKQIKELYQEIQTKIKGYELKKTESK